MVGNRINVDGGVIRRKQRKEEKKKRRSIQLKKYTYVYSINELYSFYTTVVFELGELIFFFFQCAYLTRVNFELILCVQCRIEFRSKANFHNCIVFFYFFLFDLVKIPVVLVGGVRRPRGRIYIFKSDKPRVGLWILSTRESDNHSRPVRWNVNVLLYVVVKLHSRSFELKTNTPVNVRFVPTRGCPANRFLNSPAEPTDILKISIGHIFLSIELIIRLFFFWWIIF